MVERGVIPPERERERQRKRRSEKKKKSSTRERTFRYWSFREREKEGGRESERCFEKGLNLLFTPFGVCQSYSFSRRNHLTYCVAGCRI